MAVTNTHSGDYKVSRPDLAAVVWMTNVYLQNPIARRILPEISVPTRHPVLGLYKRESILGLAGFDPENNDNAGQVAPGATYPRTLTATDDIDAHIRKYGVEYPITLEESLDMQRRWDLERAKASMCWGTLQRLGEFRVSKAIHQNTTTWTGGDLFTDNSGNPWSTTSTDIIGQVQAAKAKVEDNTGMEPNTLIVSKVTMRRMLKNDELKKYFPGAPRITQAMLADHLADVFELDQILVGSGHYNSADMGQDFAGSRLWSDKYAMVARCAMTSDPAEPCLGRTLRLRALEVPQELNIGTIDTREGIEIMTYGETQTDKYIVRGREWLDEMVLDKLFAHLMQIETI